MKIEPTLNSYASPPERVAALRGSINVERIIDCPFSLSLEEIDMILPMLKSRTALVRLPYRELGLPVEGAITHRVQAHFQRQTDRTERGRLHDELAFDWCAQSRWLPDLEGVLRVRIAGVNTRIILHAQYAPPLGNFGKLFDRAVGHRLAQATASDLVDRFAIALESQWGRELKSPPTDRSTVDP